MTALRLAAQRLYLFALERVDRTLCRLSNQIGGDE